MTYTRYVLHREAGFEVIRFGWSPGSKTARHDHGIGKGIDATGVMVVVSGRVFEEREIEGGMVRNVYEPGQVVQINQSDVHIVGCHGDEPAVTVHTYTSSVIGQGVGIMDFSTRIGA